MGVKQTILKSALTLLKNQGFASLTQPQVAKAAGCKQSHLTYYFPTRNDLLLAVAEYSVDTILTELNERLAERPHEQTLAQVIVQNIVDGLPPRVILGLIVASDDDPSIHGALSRLIDHVRDKIKNLLSQSGLRHGDDDTLLFHAAIVGLAVMHQARRSPQSEREILSGVTTLIDHLALSDDVTGGGDSW